MIDKLRPYWVPVFMTFVFMATMAALCALWLIMDREHAISRVSYWLACVQDWMLRQGKYRKAERSIRAGRVTQ